MLFLTSERDSEHNAWLPFEMCLVKIVSEIYRWQSVETKVYLIMSFIYY